MEIFDFNQVKKQERARSSSALEGLAEELFNRKIYENFSSDCNTELSSRIITINSREISAREYEGNRQVIGCNINFCAKIGDYAFNGCTSLENVCFQTRMTIEIGEGVFKNCKTIEYVVLPCELVRVSKNMFEGCCSLRTVAIPWIRVCGRFNIKGSDCFEIDDCAFKDCKSLLWLALPRVAKLVGSNVFEGCVSLRKIFVESGNDVLLNDVRKSLPAECNCEIVECNCEVIDWMLHNMKETSYLVENDIDIVANAIKAYGRIDEMIDDNGLVYSTDEKDLRRVSVHTEGIVKLKSDVKIIPFRAFENCSCLKSVVMPDTVSRIGSRAFENCTSLEYIIIQKNISAIEDYAFKGCTSLRWVFILNWEDSSFYIGKNIFEGCTALKKIFVLNEKLADKFRQALSLTNGISVEINFEESFEKSNLLSNRVWGKEKLCDFDFLSI